MKGVVSAGLRPHVFVRPGCEAEPRARAGWEHGPQVPARALRPPQAGLERRLANAKRKALQLEELLPTRVISEDQREVLRLLCRAHELERENTELQAGKLRRRHLLCRKDFVIPRHHQHRRLCEQLIHDLWQLIRDGGIPVPEALDRRFLQYSRELGEGSLNRLLLLHSVTSSSLQDGSVLNISPPAAGRGRPRPARLQEGPPVGRPG
uniref:kinesin-like protein KIF19 n=1 Tax=Halichoerus grypus TaxID=9711 RepID=UPI001659DD54|nr:kinesin-like protein KIF19 [Halichoerus grypus]